MTPTSVAVFVVLKEHRWVQVRLYDAPTTFHDDQPVRQGPILDTVRLGEHFFVGLATLDLAAANALEQGAEYAYNVFFHDRADGSGPEVSLAQHDFHLLTLDNAHRIGFGHERLPSFAVPPGDLTELRILQGSCRKPHGMGIDMLASFDDVLADGAAPSSERPHLLLLGGDQIYADDVSPPLLRMIHDASTLLLGWDEELDGTSPDEAMTDALVELDQQLDQWVDDREQQLAVWADGAGRDAAIDVLEQLAARVDDAIVGLASGDNPVRNELTRIKLRADLSGFKTIAEHWIGEAEVPDAPLQPIRAALDATIDDLVKWVETYKELFQPLATNREWGRVALLNEPADHAKLSEVGERLAALADSTSTDVGDLLDEFVEAFDLGPDGEFDGEDAEALKDAALTLAAGLGQQTGLVADDITGLAARFKEHYSPGERPGGHYRPSRVSAPQRGLELKQFASMTSEAMDAHLMFFGEFLVMYVFAWSDAVWPQIGDYESRSFVLPPYFESVPNYGLTGPLGPSGLRDAASTLVEFAQGLPKVRRVLANVPTLMIFDDHEMTDDWNLNEDWVRNVNTKPAGAQLLRNGLIAYGVFQDWGNQPEDYADASSDTSSGDTRPIGRRLLDSVTYVPADRADPADDQWDTDTESARAADPAVRPRLKPPRLFRDTDPMNLDSTVAEVNALLGVGPQQVSELTGLTIDSVLTDDDDEVAYNVVPDAGRKQWDWQYDIAAATTDPPSPTKRSVRIIALDSRTRRGFPDTAWAIKVGLSIDGQPSVDGKVAAASLIHNAELTRQLDDRLEPAHLHLIVSAAPVFGLPLLEDLVQRLWVLTYGPEVADFESWQANPHGFRMLLNSLRRADCVLLSGDVHYGYSNLMSFPGLESPDGAVGPPRLLLQLCSSSMKNETGMTQVLGAVGRDGRLADFVSPAVGEIGGMIAAGLGDLGETLDDLRSDLSNFGKWYDETAPLLDPFNPGSWATYYLKLKDTMVFSLNIPTPGGLVAVGHGVVAYVLGDLISSESGVFERDGFVMNFLSDVREPALRRTRAAALTGATTDDIVDALTPGLTTPEAKVQRTDELLSEMAEVVGYNNAGLITFTGPGTAGGDVRHELLWHPHGKNNEPFEPHTEQVIASTRHGHFAPLASLPNRIAEIAMEEYHRWNPASGRITEAEGEGIRILERYRDALIPYDDRLLALMPDLPGFEEFQVPTDAWSAVFICHVMHRAQTGDLWFHSPRHADYVRAAWQNGDEGNANPFRLYRKDHADAIVRIGDVVGGQPRDAPDDAWEEGIDDGNAHLPVGTGPLVATHFDIVVEVSDRSPRSAMIVGGNLGPSGTGTSERIRIDLDADGRLTGSRYGLIRADVV